MKDKRPRLESIYRSLDQKEKILFEIYAIATLIKLGKEDGLNVTKTRISNLDGYQKSVYTIEMEKK